MASSIILFIFSSLLTLSFPLQVEPKKPNSKPQSQIIVMGMVYCDFCSNNNFSKHSYFLPGVEVRIDCMFKAISPRTTEQISFSVNRTTDKYGIYKLEVPSVDGVQCARDKAVGNSCRASLIGISPSSSSCNIPGYRTTSDEISIKSKQENTCIYSLSALNYRPSKRAIDLCGK
ncbi:Pollen Ole e 1 allergen and extensin family protein [Forsythia ovata]|uniref:Pollen Ole e 1 allergen and extensin family protein n=1 Tax=Forsythia ovata TaxID=205694 RepID=A0ABD1UVW7_9LAMI